jgi:hypothetical protein
LLSHEKSGRKTAGLLGKGKTRCRVEEEREMLQEIQAIEALPQLSETLISKKLKYSIIHVAAN